MILLRSLKSEGIMKSMLCFFWIVMCYIVSSVFFFLLGWFGRRCAL